jgi:hypothetical protein
MAKKSFEHRRENAGAFPVSNSIVRWEHKEETVPTECAALSFAKRGLCRRQDRRKRKLININKAKLFLAPNKALERSFTRLHA